MLRKIAAMVVLPLLLASNLSILAQEKKEEKKGEQIDFEAYKKTASVEVVSSSDLSDKTNAEDMAEALKSIPGIFIRSGQINIRDASSNKVLVLIDGQRMNNAQSGEFDVTTLPIDAIEKVEVLRGGNSARFGADALGGVVNFITKKADAQSKMDVGIRATYGSFNSQFYNIYTSNRIEKFDYYVSYKRTQSDGNFKYKDFEGKEQTRENNWNKGNDVMAKVGYQVGETANLGLTTQFSQSKMGSAGSVKGIQNWGMPSPRAEMKLDNQIYNLSYDQKNIFGNADLNARIYTHFFRTRFTDPDSYDPSQKEGSDQKSQARGLDLTQNMMVNDLLSLTYGYVYRFDKANSTQLGEKNRNTHSGHLAATLGFKPEDFFISSIQIIPAVRYDAPSDFDKVFSPKVSLILSNAGPFALNFSAHVSKSYRAPTFNDLYWPEDSYTAGNPNLKPEKGTNYDIGFGFTLPVIGNIPVRFNYFNNDMRDQIIWAPRQSDFKWTPTNVDTSITSGLETYIGFSPFGETFRFEINHTYMDARNKSGLNKDKILFYRPFNKLDVNSSFKYSIFELNLNYQYMSSRFIDAANSAALPPLDLWSVNIGCNTEFAKLKWMIRLDMNNVTDKSYQLNDGYPMPGREIRATIGLNLL
ncbi:MAG: TonB-dependent receptor plug domain-containing protein [Ignavibacteriales bacterium]